MITADLFHIQSTDRRFVVMQERTKELCDLTLKQFIVQAWPVLEPSTRFIDGWHIDALAEHLTAVTNGEIRHLIINIPPGMMKSMTVSVFWPVWLWTKKPQTRFITASYAASLAMRDSLKSRRLIQSQWFQHRWAAVFQLTGDQNQKTRYENNRTGFRLATSVGGSTGERADIRILDDPHNINDIGSDVIRESTIEWTDHVWSERASDSTTSSDVVIMQRLHERDVSGHLLEDIGGYEHLMLPMRFESDRRCFTSIGFSDPRETDGELLCSARFDETAVIEKEKRLGSYGAAGQLQQRPAPRGGGMFKRQWFEIVDTFPRDMTFVRYWDKAATEAGKGTTSFSTGVLGAVDRQRIFYVLDVIRGQWSYGQRDQIIKQTAQLDAATYGNDNPATIKIWTEQEPGSGGKESAESSIKMLAGYPTYADKVTGSKEVRAQPLASYAEAGNVKLIKADWNKGYLDRMCFFPMGTYKDETDATSGAFNHLLHLGAPMLKETLDEISKADIGRFNRGDMESRWHRR